MKPGDDPNRLQREVKRAVATTRDLPGWMVKASPRADRFGVVASAAQKTAAKKSGRAR